MSHLNFGINQSQNLDKQSCEKNIKTESDDVDMKDISTSVVVDKPKKNPSLSLTRFFKPLDNE